MTGTRVPALTSPQPNSIDRGSSTQIRRDEGRAARDDTISDEVPRAGMVRLRTTANHRLIDDLRVDLLRVVVRDHTAGTDDERAPEHDQASHAEGQCIADASPIPASRSTHAANAATPPARSTRERRSGRTRLISPALDQRR